MKNKYKWTNTTYLISWSSARVGERNNFWFVTQRSSVACFRWFTNQIREIKIRIETPFPRRSWLQIIECSKIREIQRFVIWLQNLHVRGPPLNHYTRHFHRVLPSISKMSLPTISNTFSKSFQIIKINTINMNENGRWKFYLKYTKKIINMNY